MTLVSEQGKQIAVQGKFIAEQFSVVSSHLATATMHFSESLAIIKGEVAQLKVLVGDTAVEAKDKVELVSRTIDPNAPSGSNDNRLHTFEGYRAGSRTRLIMAGFRRGLDPPLRPCQSPLIKPTARMRCL